MRANLGNLALAACLLLVPLCQAADYWLYAGTYTNQHSKGIYAARFHSDSGKLDPVVLATETPNPSFLAIHRDRPFLYAVNENSNGTASAFSIDAASGKLSPLNTVATRGAGPCHLALDHTGRTLLVANYSGGSVAAFPVHQDGSLGETTAFFQHTGSSKTAQRQAGPHAHCVLPSPDNRFALVADLGLDEILVYRLNAARASLAPFQPAFARVAAGSGPRHLAFHPNSHYLYAINELASTVTAFAYDAGRLRELQTVSTLPPDFHGESTTAEIAVHPSGKFLYGSNRGHDSIAVFSIDPASGSLRLVQVVATQGKMPRSFAIDPSGRWLLAANQNSNTIVVFRIDLASGKLAPTADVLNAPTPVCLTFAAAH